jgi:hypothetical protein
VAAGCPSRAARPRLELADVFRSHGEQLGPLSAVESQAVRAITSCRTAALGGHVQECDHCGHRDVSYNSCRNRHCPKCEGLKKARWVEARRSDLLPAEYHHVVFTIPQELHPIFLADPKVAIDLLFAAVSETLQEVALNPKRMGARIGFTAVLHTWTQTLAYHPHIHCIVPGGGISPKGDRWIAAKPGFLLPVRVLSLVFRGKLLSMLEGATGKRRLQTEAKKVLPLLARAALKKWVVYSKPPVAGPDQVLEYLGRYTHRIAISNERLVSLHEGQVTFRWKDRAHGNQQKLLTLDALEFLRRFLLHVLPKRLVRIRHYGFLANSVRRREVAQCRTLLKVPSDRCPKDDEHRKSETWQELLLRLTGRDVTLCPHCKQGRLMERETLTPAAYTWRLLGRGTSP